MFKPSGSIPLDGMLVLHRVTLSSEFAGTHFYTWAERKVLLERCLAQDHNAVPQSGLDPRPNDPESNALTIRPPCLPYIHKQISKQDCLVLLAIFNSWQKSLILLHFLEVK